MKKQSVFLVLEHTKFGTYASAFKTKKAQGKRVKELLKEYSKEYGKEIETTQQLGEMTFDEVFIDAFETVLE